MASAMPLRLVAALILYVSFTITGAFCAKPTLSADSSHVPSVRYFFSDYLDSADTDLPTWRIASAVVCGAIAASLSSAGGLGGGGLFVPIFNLLLGFSSKRAAALSTCMIFGGTLVNQFWYVLQRRADGHGPLIDYHVSLLCLPNVLLGISLGVFCNVASPSWLVAVVLVIVLILMTVRSCHNACHLWSLETRALQVDEPILPHTVNDSDCGVVVSPQSDDAHADKYVGNKEVEKPLLQRADVKDLPQYPPLKITSLFVIWTAFLVVQIVRGSSDGQNLFGVETCGPVYWTVTLFQVPFAVLVTAFTLIYFQHQNSDGGSLEDGELPSSGEQPSGLIELTWLPAYALLAGLLGGMLGLGGGTIISPLLLETGMHPQVTAATCSFMVFFSSSLSVVQYWLLGRILLSYALSFGALSLVFSVIGLQAVHFMIVKYGRVSMIVFSVSIVMGISAALMAFFGTWEGIIQFEDGEYMGFQSPC